MNSAKINKHSAFKALALAAAAGTSCFGLASMASASAIDVGLTRTAVANPVSGAAALSTPMLGIPDAPSVNYDAADINDSGTLWNQLLVPSVSTTGTTVLESAVPLNDSFGNTTPVQLNVSLASGTKNDSIHNEGVSTASTPEDDGLVPNPAALMSQSWQLNSTNEQIIFELTGLNPGAPYNLYVYGAGTNRGNGGGFALPDTVNQGVGYGTGAGWDAATSDYNTEPTNNDAHDIHRSVFDATNIDPTPEQGLSWVLLPTVADPNGDATFTVSLDANVGTFAGNIKGSINGFQIQPAPEPASLGVAAMAITGMLAGRRRR